MKRGSIIIAILIFAILATACGKETIKTVPANATTEVSTTPEATTGAENVTVETIDFSQVTLRVGQTGWASGETQIKAAGLDDTPYKVEYTVFQGGNLNLEAMAAGHLDLCASSEIPPIFASLAAGGGNFKIIAISNGSTLQQELVIPKDSKITSVAELKGKKVAFVKSTTANYFLLKMLQAAGLEWEDIIAVELSTADGLTALISGQVDALASYGNAITSAHQNGATTLQSAKDILSGNFPYEASLQAIEDPVLHAAIVDYLGRVEKSTAWARENVEVWAKITAENTHQEVADVIATITEANAQRETHLIPVSDDTIASQQDIVNVFVEAGLLTQTFDVTPIWSDAFNEEISNFSEVK